MKNISPSEYLQAMIDVREEYFKHRDCPHCPYYWEECYNFTYFVCDGVVTMAQALNVQGVPAAVREYDKAKR